MSQSPNIPPCALPDTASAELTAVVERARWYVIAAKGLMAFRFGPFNGPEVGAIMTRCAEEGHQVLITADCGVPLSWEVLRELTAQSETPESV